MNLNFLKSLHKIWKDAGLLEDTVKIDFSTIPYWGDGDHLGNHWSGKRGKALKGMLAVLAQDPDSGIINYGSTTIRKEDESKEILGFLDFCHQIRGKPGVGSQNHEKLAPQSLFERFIMNEADIKIKKSKCR